MKRLVSFLVKYEKIRIENKRYDNRLAFGSTYLHLFVDSGAVGSTVYVADICSLSCRRNTRCKKGRGGNTRLPPARCSGVTRIFGLSGWCRSTSRCNGRLCFRFCALSSDCRLFGRKMEKQAFAERDFLHHCDRSLLPHRNALVCICLR